MNYFEESYKININRFHSPQILVKDKYKISIFNLIQFYYTSVSDKW